MTPRPTRVVILGGGFGGVYTAMHLRRLVPDEAALSITLVNRDNFFLFTPMLHEVAASDVEITNIVNPIRKLLTNGVVMCGEVEAIDLDAKRVTVSHGDGGHRHAIEYDHLVLALGSVTNFYNVPGLEGRAFTMKSLGDAIALRNHVIARLEEADFECAVGLRHELLTFVVAGGGFAGVETIAALNDFAREALRFYPHLNEHDLRFVLVHPGPVILPELGEKLGRYAQQRLGKRGVDIRTGTSVAGLSEQGVQLSDGSVIPTQTIIWTAGTSANPLVTKLPLQLERGRVVADAHLRVPGRLGVWALGDCALVPNPRTGQPHPPTAQHALRQGKVLARNIVAMIRGRPTAPFDFGGLGQLAAIGRRTGVARILGINFSGFIAWWLWRSIYLMKLPGVDRKVRVALDWTLDVFFSKDLVQFQTVRTAVMSDSESPEIAIDPGPSRRRHTPAPAGAAR